MNNTVVIDIGTATTKAGFEGEEYPRLVFPTLVGYINYDLNNYEAFIPKDRIDEDYFIGEEVLQLKDGLKLKYPIKRGVIKDWESMEKILHYIFYKGLDIDPRAYPVLLTEYPLNIESNRKKIIEIMFGTFKVPAVNFTMQPLLSAYRIGRTTGCVVEIGEITHIVPILHGYPIKDAIKRLDFGGGDIDDYLLELIKEKGVSIQEESYISPQIRNIKEKLCYVAMDPEREMRLSKIVAGMEITWMTPDGDIIPLNYERFLAPECIFDPTRIKKEIEPLHVEIFNAISQCDEEMRENLFSSIILSGGSTMFPGIKERLTKEIKEQIPESVDVKIIAPPERMYSAWMGGTVAASLRDFQNQCITYIEYCFEGSRDFERFDPYHKEEVIHNEKTIDPQLESEIQNFLDWVRDSEGLAGYIKYYLQENNTQIISELSKIYYELRKIIGV